MLYYLDYTKSTLLTLAIKKIYNLPLGAFQVSGEYAMMKAAGRAGIANVNNLLLESLISIRRAGADMIFSYACEEIANLI